MVGWLVGLSPLAAVQNATAKVYGKRMRTVSRSQTGRKELASVPQLRAFH